METATFTGLLAPAGTPKEIVDQLSKALQKILNQASIKEKFEKLGAEARASTSQEFATYLSAEDAKWVPVIKRANIKAN
jgi:tripartite-type tricarboxylate transporter receptor subunit TctC